MVADNPRCDSPVAEKLPENSQFDQTAYPFPALPTPPRDRQVPPTSMRVAFPKVAKKLGINQAHILSQIHYWITNPNAGYIKQDGRKWVWLTYSMLEIQLPWMSIQQIGRYVRELEGIGLMLSTNKFNTTRYNRTKWYSPDYIAIDDYFPDNPYAEYAIRPQTLESSNLNIREFSDERSNIYYPQKKSTDDNNINDDASLKISQEGSVTSTGTSSAEGQNEYCTEKERFSLPEDAQTIADRSQHDRVCEEMVCKPSPKPKPKLPKPKKREEVKQEALNNPEKEDIGQALDDAGLMSPKLMSLALKYSLDEVNKAVEMLQKQPTVKNAAGWLTSCLKGRWWKQHPRRKAVPTKPWEAEFNPWYRWAISEQIVEPVSVRHLATDHRGEPIVHLAIPDRFLGIPYTSESWRTARKQFPMPDGALEKLSSSLPTDDPPPIAKDDWEQNCQIQSIEENSTSDEFLDSSLGDVSRKSSSNHLPEPPSLVARNHPIESVTEDSSLDNPPDSSPGDDSPTALSSVEQSPPVESVNENGLSESPPETSSGSVSRKVAFDFTDPDWMTFPWEPKNGWQPGTERERSRRHKAEWCRSQLLRVSSDEEMHELFNQLGDCALACLEWVDRHLLTPHEIATRHVRMEAGRNYEQQSLLE